MASRDLKRRLVKIGLGFAVGSSVFQLGSCDPTVRATILTGLEQTTGTLLNTINSAFFISLQDDEEDQGTNAGLSTT